MKGRKAFLIVQSVLCAATAGLLASAALSLYLEGAARQAAGDLFYSIFTREKAAARLLPILPLFFGSLGMTVSGLILGIRDENQDRPVKEPKDYTGPKTQPDPGRQKIVRLIVLAAALIMIVAGIFNGSMHDVLMKAIMICTECVGLGKGG